VVSCDAKKSISSFAIMLLAPVRVMCAYCIHMCTSCMHKLCKRMYAQNTMQTLETEFFREALYSYVHTHTHTHTHKDTHMHA
jgi:hypothetical protein